MYKKAKQVIVTEHLTDGPYTFGAILVDKNTLIAMDNGAILNPKDDWIEIVKELPWVSLSSELMGDWI